MRFLTNLTLLAFFSFIGCSRPVDKNDSSITIQTPTRAELASKVSAFASLPSTKRICFAVNVLGSGIESKTVNCSKTLGTVIGFVGDGEALTFTLPTGSNRTFELYTYLADLGTACPSWNDGFNSAADNFKKTYYSGVTSGVNIEGANVDVGINLSFPGEEHSVAADIGGACNVIPKASPKLRGLLNSSGALINVQSNPDTVLSISLAYLTSFFEFVLGQYDQSGIGFGTASSGLNIGTIGVQAPPYLKSLTMKPDTKEIFALDESGHIQKINASTGASEDFVCPFKNCSLPAWVQSISAGYDNNIYALDHSGQLYTVTENGLETLGVTVLPSVIQVSYY